MTSTVESASIARSKMRKHTSIQCKSSLIVDAAPRVVDSEGKKDAESLGGADAVGCDVTTSAFKYSCSRLAVAVNAALDVDAVVLSQGSVIDVSVNSNGSQSNATGMRVRAECCTAASKEPSQRSSKARSLPAIIAAGLDVNDERSLVSPLANEVAIRPFGGQHNEITATVARQKNGSVRNCSGHELAPSFEFCISSTQAHQHQVAS